MSKHKPPKKIWAYIADTLDDGSPLWCLSETLDEIPEDQNGETIVQYTLDHKATFIVTREAI